MQRSASVKSADGADVQPPQVASPPLWEDVASENRTWDVTSSSRPESHGHEYVIEIHAILFLSKHVPVVSALCLPAHLGRVNASCFGYAPMYYLETCCRHLMFPLSQRQLKEKLTQRFSRPFTPRSILVAFEPAVPYRVVCTSASHCHISPSFIRSIHDFVFIPSLQHRSSSECVGPCRAPRVPKV